MKINKVKHWLKYPLFLCLLALPMASQASLSSYYLDWSGATTINNPDAQAHALLTLDDSVFPHTTSGVFDTADSLGIVGFSITVSGTGAGDGTFGLSDFAAFSWNSNGDTMDWSQDIVGQGVTGGSWGVWVQPLGDFNFLANDGSNAPTMAGAYLISAANSGETLSLTSFRPVPVPGAVWLFGSALAGLIGFGRKRLTSET